MLAITVTLAVAAALSASVVGWIGRRGWRLAQLILIGIVAALVLWNVVFIFTDLPTGIQVGVGALGGAVAAGMFFLGRRFAARTAQARAIAAMVMAAVLAALPVPALTVVAGRLPELPQAAPNMEKTVVDPLAYVRVPEFVTRPNVYLVGMLAAVPNSLLARHLGGSASRLNTYLETGDFRVLRNVFSETYPTRNSLDLMLSLNRNYLLDLKDYVTGGMVSGNTPSPLLTIFTMNGYETNALYEDTKFGAMKGPFVDHYEIAQRPSICRDGFVDGPARDIGFFGACRLSRAFPLSLLRPSLDDVFSEHLARLSDIGSRSRPQLTILQLRPPFHYTGQKLADVDSAAVRNFAARYETSAVDAAVNLERLVGQVRTDDPDALVFVFGDQGLGLSQDLTADGRTPFFVHDKLGVVGAVLPAAACSEYLPAQDSTAILTTVQIVADLIGCLAGGESIYPAGYEHRALIGGETFLLSPYAYE